MGTFSLLQLETMLKMATIFGPASLLPKCNQLRLPIAIGLIEFSAQLVDNSMMGWRGSESASPSASAHTKSPDRQWTSAGPILTAASQAAAHATHRVMHLAVDRKQAIHERDNTFHLWVGYLGLGLDLDCINKLSLRVSKATSVDQIFQADIFFICGITIRVEDAAIVFEEGFRHSFAACHLEVEDHTFAWRAVLPESSGARNLTSALSQNPA
jgi:hypothetical protein